MEFVNINNLFDPTPKLQSSPIPISFVSFDYSDDNCFCCGVKYSMTTLIYQKYCKRCLSRYILHINDNKPYLDVTIRNLKESDDEHEMNRSKKSYELTQNIQEWRDNSSEIRHFRQISTRPCFNHNTSDHDKYCKLCGKLIYKHQQIDSRVCRSILCSDCYKISFTRVESTLTKKSIPILYLPWWYCGKVCIACSARLSCASLKSDCQKYCPRCYVIYTGCRYCLTTNVIFGPADQSQCKKCKRVSHISFDAFGITNIGSGNSDLDDFLYDSRFNTYNNFKIGEITKHMKDAKYIIPTDIYEFVYNRCRNKFLESTIEFIPYSQISNMKEIAKGGSSIIYESTWVDGPKVAIKRFKNSHQHINKYFLNELKSSHHCFKFNHHVIKYYGFTIDPKSNEYMLIMQYASGGDLHKYLQENFAKTVWKEKIRILWQISNGLETIHKANFVHSDFHSGNILFDPSNNKKYQWKIGDFGLSQPANSSNNEIYGVVPYIAPEIFKGSVFSKKSDVYSFGMIMWELTTGYKPFSNVEHDHILIYKVLNGKRPEITDDTPECFANLMKACWDDDPKKRPSITKIRKTFGSWRCGNQFDQAETKRNALINSKKLYPEVTGKYHSNAIYTSRPLSSLMISDSILECTEGYISKELEYDINNSTDQQDLSSSYISKELEYDINKSTGQDLSSSELFFF